MQEWGPRAPYSQGLLPCLELLRPSRPLTDPSWRPSCQADRCNVAPCSHYCSSGWISEHSLHYRALLVTVVFDNKLLVGPPCVLHCIYNNSCQCRKLGGLVFSGPPCALHIIYNNLCDSEVRPTRDFIILNKSPTQPPRHEEDIGLRILVRFPSRVRTYRMCFLGVLN